MQEMRVLAIGVDPRGAQPVLLLQETEGQHRVLPVWVGLPEATAIEFERQGASAPRPMTHQLIGQVVGSFGRRVEQVGITTLREGIFHAEIVFDQGTRVSARVTDAVALALHLGVPIRAEDAVLDEAALASTEVVRTSRSEIEGETGADLSPDEIERFREFLDSASPEDFGNS
jgi:bifunctional DNase/RNase